MSNIELHNELDIEIEIQSIVNALRQNPEALRDIAIAVRNMQTKQVRRMGNLYSKRAQVQKPPPTTKTRLT